MNITAVDLNNCYSHKGIKKGEVLSFPSSKSMKMYSHIIGGRYPCRSTPLVPRSILSDFSTSKEVRVLDPFMGSGTTAIESILRGFQPYGVEVDPYARLISDVSSTRFSPKQISSIVDIYKKIESVFMRKQVDETLHPKLNKIDYWFTENNFFELLVLKTAIHETTKTNSISRKFYLLLLGDIVRACSKAERQSLKPYISTRFPKKEHNVINEFHKAFGKYIAAIKDSNKFYKNGLNVEWIGEDATEFKSKLKVDVAITSPPYINAMDYTRCIKLESAWVGTASDEVLKFVRSKQLGENSRAKQNISDSINSLMSPYLEPIAAVDPQRAKTIQAYFEDMYKNISCVYHTLKKGSSYHIIIGDSVIRKTYIPTHEILYQIASTVGFSLDSHYSYRVRDHRTSIPRQGQGGKIDIEHVISLQKS
jgi:DNA modification methylase